ncbi:MAG: agmatinase family protein [Bacteroidia bacterium]
MNTINFDPNGLGMANGNLYGLPFSVEEAKLVIIPVPWEVTVSYRAGTADGPQAILDASLQVDLFDEEIPDAWKLGIAMLPISTEIREKSDNLRTKATIIIEALENEAEASTYVHLYEEINREGEALKNNLCEIALNLMRQGKKVALLGGDHSTPLGLMQAFAQEYEEYGILHIDAHCDLREAYEGFTYSHASIMYNALAFPQISKLVQVGIRDFCEAEAQLAQDSEGRVVIHSHREMAKARFVGKTWEEICEKIVVQLPENVYISFDIDGLDPALCPNTGTPVAGGLQLEEAMFLIEKVVTSGRTIIGFDLNEVAPNPNGEDEWDANVGARVLYRLCNFMGKSHRYLLG